jgi:hypothetical protein
MVIGEVNVVIEDLEGSAWMPGVRWDLNIEFGEGIR